MTSLVRSRWAAIGAAVAVTLGAGGLISVNAAGDTSSLVPITPTRILDTRSADRVGSLDTAGASDPYRLKVTGTTNIPATGVTGVSLNVTAVDTQTNDFGGFVSVYPCASVSTAKPDVSNMNFGSGQTIANAVTVPVSTDGYICLYVYGTAHLLVDTNGYYTQTSAATGEQGPAGEAGPTGATGPQGPAGPVNRISDEQIAMLAWHNDPGKAATIEVGSNPSGVASDGTNIFVTNYGDGNVSVIDPTTNTVTTTITVGIGPIGMAYDGTNIYVTNLESSNVSVIDPTTNTVTATITVGDDPRYVASTGDLIFVTNYGDGNVSVIDPTTNTVIDTIATAISPFATAFDGTSIYVTHTALNEVSVIDPTTNAVIDTISVGAWPIGLAFDGTYIYVTSLDDDKVSVIDPTTNTVTTTISVGDRPFGVAFDGTNVYVANSGSGTVSKLRPR